MLKYFLIFSILISTAKASKLTIDKKVFNGESVEFLEHKGSGQWDNYLVMNLPFEPIAKLFSQLLIAQRRQLTNRGEAHITIITPVEYWKQLKPYGVTIEEINRIALENKIQSSRFIIKCLGIGKSQIDNKEEKTYYLVVKSENFLKIRMEIEKLLKEKTQAKKLNFDAKKFYPHITLGFTLKDLHLESHGVKKDVSSCASDVLINN